MTEIVNHLWQSTIFLGFAAAGALALRSNRAKVRYWLWMAASLKFLIPFSLLVSFGAGVDAPAVASAVPAIAVERLTSSFSPVPLTGVSTAGGGTYWWTQLVVAIWALGTALVLFRWVRRWLSLRTAMRMALQLQIPSPIPVLSSRTQVEPGVFGLFSQVLLLPEGIENKLSAAEFNAILVHELEHVRRRDNMTAMLHMLVEALFWFYPLVWWIGMRLIEERERACDEAVIRMGVRPQVYAEGIVSVCKFYVQSNLPCAAGVTGADLKKRISEIMNGRFSQRLTFTRKLVLATATAGIMAIPVFIGIVSAQTKVDSLIFEVASIRPSDPNGRGLHFANTPEGGIRATGVTLKFLVEFAYEVQDFQIAGGPGWFRSDRYDILAKLEKPAESDIGKKTGDAEQKTQADRLRERVRALLAERFQLVIRRETGKRPVYELVQAKNGHKLQSATDEGRGISRNRGHLQGEGVSVAMLTRLLSSIVSRPVLDLTNVAGKYNFKLDWTEEFSGPGKGGDGPTGPPPTEVGGASIFTAIQEQLGLKLEATTGSVEVLFIEKAEKPTAN